MAPENIRQTLTTVYNVALALGLMISKKPKAVTINECRPISLLEVPWKVLYQLLNSRVQQYMEDNNVFQDEQFGFRRYRGTNTASNRSDQRNHRAEDSQETRQNGSS